MYVYRIIVPDLFLYKIDLMQRSKSTINNIKTIEVINFKLSYNEPT